MVIAMHMEAFLAKSSSYFKDHNDVEDDIEGGPNDRLGRPLCSLQQFLANEVPYISVAMDYLIFPYGTQICIPELELVYGQVLRFQVVDTGSAFRHAGRTKIDIHVNTRTESLDPRLNQMLTCVALVKDEGVI